MTKEEFLISEKEFDADITILALRLGLNDSWNTSAPSLPRIEVCTSLYCRRSLRSLASVQLTIRCGTTHPDEN